MTWLLLIYQMLKMEVRGKKNKCYANVKQFSELFTPSLEGHNHPPSPDVLKNVIISVKVKECAQANVYRSAPEIVETVMKECLTVDSFNLPKPSNLVRAANYQRQKIRPKEPVTLDYELDLNFIGPDFVLDDIRLDGARHLLLATPSQLNHLKQAKRWFIDGTFKLVRRPFYQLMSIHAFVKKGEDVKQIPLLYVLMSRRSKIDYIEVFNCLRRHMPQPLVEWVMVDFEAGCVVKGCVFHWAQRVYRKIQSEGLATAYVSRGDKFMFLRKLMALPFLPAEHIRNAFDALHTQAADIGGPILKVCDYVRRTWVESQMWRPENWSVFRETVRTNNDVEGWHRRMNSRAGRGDLALYVLVPFLRTESETVDLQVRLVTENLLTRIHRKRSSEVHGRLFEAWDQYEDDELTTSQLLRTCSQISGLATICSNDRIHDEE